VDSVSFGATGLWPGKSPKHSEGLDAHLTLRLRDRYLRSGMSWLSAVEANEGALYALFLLAILFHPATPRVLAIDNVDQALNPRLARFLLERVQAIVLAEPKRPQMLVTTHNPLVLDALDLKDERVRLFVINRDKKSGATGVRRILHSRALDQSEKPDMTLSRLWISGGLGGMPAL
jgi:predicted ATPase